ncbi:hypothetical protein C8Q77DRAFT_886812 [Trametes polyzona]|nr:hypothetical protein C8Q77DRAFT_886812 [Trametes polyzona]
MCSKVEPTVALRLRGGAPSAPSTPPEGSRSSESYSVAVGTPHNCRVGEEIPGRMSDPLVETGLGHQQTGVTIVS